MCYGVLPIHPSFIVLIPYMQTVCQRPDDIGKYFPSPFDIAVKLISLTTGAVKPTISANGMQKKLKFKKV